MNKLCRTLLCAIVLCPIGIRAQDFTTLHSFSGFDGINPYQAPLIQGEDGNLYGTTANGGSGGGTVFRITAQGALTTLYNFCQKSNCSDGALPLAGLALAEDGNFYGTTASGGDNGWGTAFKMTHDGALTTLHSFCLEANCLDGASPYGGLVQATDGHLYGTTEQGGGSMGAGTVFRITAEGKFTTIHNFCSQGCGDGYSPRGSLIQATDGNLYGTTSSGGYNDGGTVYRIDKHGAFAYVELLDASGGGGPMAGLLQATGGLYGTTLYGGPKFDGTMFRVSHDQATTLHRFCIYKDCLDGSRPTAVLIQSTDGSFYGTTSNGGNISCISRSSNGCGTVFQITPNRRFVTVHTFEASDGSNPNAGLFQATNGVLYGVTSSGGDAAIELDCAIYGCGTIYSLNAGLGPFVAFVQGAGEVGSSKGVLGQGFTGTTAVSFNGTPAVFTVKSDTFILVTVPSGATTGYVTVTSPGGTLTSNVPFRVIP